MLAARTISILFILLIKWQVYDNTMDLHVYPIFCCIYGINFVFQNSEVSPNLSE